MCDYTHFFLGVSLVILGARRRHCYFGVRHALEIPRIERRYSFSGLAIPFELSKEESVRFGKWKRKRRKDLSSRRLLYRLDCCVDTLEGKKTVTYRYDAE